jgi:hypothetical protein
MKIAQQQQANMKGKGSTGMMDVEYLQEISNSMMTRFDLIARQCSVVL